MMVVYFFEVYHLHDKRTNEQEREKEKMQSLIQNLMKKEDKQREKI